MSSGELDIKIDLSAYNTTLGKLIRSVKGVELSLIHISEPTRPY